MDERMVNISEAIGEAACYELLAEEAVELAHACLKKARIIRGENPTPAKLEAVDSNVQEEFTDVILAGDTCGLRVNGHLYEQKIRRFMKRLGM